MFVFGVNVALAVGCWLTVMVIWAVLIQPFAFVPVTVYVVVAVGNGR
jgi:hypothetical protein